ncbi:hypothetical protein Pden_3034 [Paracoccus denitrificans PD1222]|uniref:Uncharacterized protein n=2 Tax=Paracoccus denitrificans TaxID=266 RepID=A1B6H3_PARDP|nr:hypothetical protein Pden_3034 [Paracoccus denitrificans PD1222]
MIIETAAMNSRTFEPSFFRSGCLGRWRNLSAHPCARVSSHRAICRNMPFAFPSLCLNEYNDSVGCEEETGVVVRASHRDPSWGLGKERLQALHLRIGQPEKIAHRSGLLAEPESRQTPEINGSGA